MVWSKGKYQKLEGAAVADLAIVIRQLKGCSSKNLVNRPGSIEQRFAVNNLPPGN